MVNLSQQFGSLKENTEQFDSEKENTDHSSYANCVEFNDKTEYGTDQIATEIEILIKIAIR